VKAKDHDDEVRRLDAEAKGEVRRRLELREREPARRGDRCGAAASNRWYDLQFPNIRDAVRVSRTDTFAQCQQEG
ncbi:MAG TPA: hypothetical protein VH277_05075, partial [Gemmatimonadaceae bacterium]|nr:hypothetical protein [Gemmatimonadaceae bacterium]